MPQYTTTCTVQNEHFFIVQVLKFSPTVLQNLTNRTPVTKKPFLKVEWRMSLIIYKWSPRGFNYFNKVKTKTKKQMRYNNSDKNSSPT